MEKFPYFILGRAEWKLVGKPTYPDAKRGVINPVCEIEWSLGDHYYVDIHRKQKVQATHWTPCDCPNFEVQQQSANPAQG